MLKRIGFWGCAGLIVVLAGGCVTPAHVQHQKIAEPMIAQENWDGAMDEVLAALRVKPDYGKSIDSLVIIAPRFYDYHQRAGEEAGKRFDWTQAFHHLDRIKYAEREIGLLNLVHKKTGEPMVTPAPDIEDVYGAMQREAATQYYADAFELQGEGKTKEAARAFRRADEVLPGFEDSRERYNTLRAEAMQRVAVLGACQQKLSPIAEHLATNFLDFVRKEDVASYITFMGLDDKQVADQQTAENAIKAFREHLEFVEFMTPAEARAKGQGTVVVDGVSPVQVGRALNADYLLLFRVNQATSNFPPVRYQQLSGSGEVTPLFGGDTRYVSCNVTVYTADGEVGINAGYELIRVADGSLLASQHYTARAAEQYQWARYSGDRDALRFVPWSGTALSTLVEMPEGAPKLDGLVLRANHDILKAGTMMAAEALGGL